MNCGGMVLAVLSFAGYGVDWGGLRERTTASRVGTTSLVALTARYLTTTFKVRTLRTTYLAAGTGVLHIVTSHLISKNPRDRTLKGILFKTMVPFWLSSTAGMSQTVWHLVQFVLPMK
eukprot:4942755-Amphidinium_carterae.1